MTVAQLTLPPLFLWPLSLWSKLLPLLPSLPLLPLQIHGHLCMAAVVVTDTLDWRLHGFDLTSEHALTGQS